MLLIHLRVLQLALFLIVFNPIFWSQFNFECLGWLWHYFDLIKTQFSYCNSMLNSPSDSGLALIYPRSSFLIAILFWVLWLTLALFYFDWKIIFGFDLLNRSWFHLIYPNLLRSIFDLTWVSNLALILINSTLSIPADK